MKSDVLAGEDCIQPEPAIGPDCLIDCSVANCYRPGLAVL